MAIERTWNEENPLDSCVFCGNVIQPGDDAYDAQGRAWHQQCMDKAEEQDFDVDKLER